MRANEFVKEGVNDPAIFKVVFVIGGPGSGKSYVSRQLGLNAMGYVTVNSDVAFEYLMGKHSIDPKMPPEEKEKRDVIRARAKELTGKKSDLAIEGRLGIHIDGTGDDYDKVANLKKNFERLGYDCYLVVVNTRLEVAKQRNQMRSRTVPDKIVTNSWYDVQDNIGRFANIFTYLSIIDNSGDAKSTDTQITKVHAQLQKFADSEPTKPAAKEWIANQKKVNEKWSQKYKSSINCSNPKGFSQRAHCQGRKKKTDESIQKPGQWTVDSIREVLPIAKEIWFHGSRAIGKHKRTSDTDILVVVPDEYTGESYLKILRILQKLSSQHKGYDIQPTHRDNNIYRIAQEEGKLLWKEVSEASYAGNLGAMEMIKFKQVATPELWALMKKLIADGKEEEAWALLQKVTKTKLK